MKKILVLAAALIANTAVITTAAESEDMVEPVKLSGFRIGASYLAGGKADELRKALGDDKAVPVISQFGWHQEIVIPAGDNGTAAVVQFIPLLGGFDQGLIIPNINMPVGIRSYSGWEVGAGPHLSLGQVGEKAKLSTGFVVAVGKSFEMGKLKVPVNVAYMQGRGNDNSNAGYTLSALSGFAF